MLLNWNKYTITSFEKILKNEKLDRLMSVEIIFDIWESISKKELESTILTNKALTTKKILLEEYDA